MTIPVLPYDFKNYNSLPELSVAKAQFEAARVSEILFAEIGMAFVKHHVESTLGVTLLHNHFLLEPDEMLVNISSTAVPWDMRSNAKELTNVGASAWRFTEKGVAPYEFTHGASEVPLDNAAMQLFLEELGALLLSKNLTHILGVCSLGKNSFDKPSTMEFTSGRANITLPFDISSDDDNVIDAMWQFSSNLFRFGFTIDAGKNQQGKQDMIAICHSFRS